MARLKLTVSLVLFAALPPLAAAACSSGDSVAPAADAGIDTPVDGVNACFVNGCFDDDFCTDDLCTEDGACIHVPRDPFNACQTVAHCDDDDPCSIDSCVLDECGLMRCRHEWPDPMCQRCRDDTWCEDGNPCTTDTCGEDGMCDFSDADPNCEPRCQPDFAYSIYDAQWFGPMGDYVQSYIGIAGAQNGATCAGSDCTCGDELAMGEAGFNVPLRAGVGMEEVAFGCTVDACELHQATCAPMIAGVGYVTWGILRFKEAFKQAIPTPADAGAASDTAPSSDEGAPWMPPIDALEVEGFCLSTRFDHVVGDYRGTFESDGAKAVFDMVFEHDFAGGVRATMMSCTGCEELGLVPNQTTSLEPERDVVALSVALSSGSARTRLYARGNTFSGDVVTDDGTFQGLLTLERVMR